MGTVTSISVKTGMAMVVPTALDTLARTAWADVHVIWACEEDCDDSDDIEATVLADLFIIFKDLPLIKCMHKNANSSVEKVH